MQNFAKSHASVRLLNTNHEILREISRNNVQSSECATMMFSKMAVPWKKFGECIIVHLKGNCQFPFKNLTEWSVF